MVRSAVLGALIILGAAATAGGASAQPYGDDDRYAYGAVPPGDLPRPWWRVWNPDRPPGHQPPPTSCRRAERIADRTGGEVVYGGERYRAAPYAGSHGRDTSYRDVRACAEYGRYGDCIRWGYRRY